MEVREKEVTKMTTMTVIALVVAVPVILFPAAFVWYLNIGGMVAAARRAKAARAVNTAKVTN